MATMRADGLPRVSPVEPLIWKGHLWLSMGWGSRKAIDLLRDERVLLHSIVTSREGTNGEYKLRGSTVVEDDQELQFGYAAAMNAQAAWEPEPGRFHLFRVDVADVTFIRWDNATNDQYVTRWPARKEFVRRGTSATSLGDPEPYASLLVPPSI